MKYRLFLLLLSGLLAFSANAQVHKWVDEHNQVHYSDQPAPGKASSVPLVTPAAVPAAAETGQKSVAEREAEYRKEKKAREEDEAKAAKQQEQELAKKKYCEEARASVKSLESGQGTTTYDAKGELVILDDTERKKRIAEIKKEMGVHCQ